MIQIQTSFIGTGSHLQLKEERYLVFFFYLFNPEPTSNILETDIPFTRKFVDGMGIWDWGWDRAWRIDKQTLRLREQGARARSGDLRKSERARI